MQKSHGDVLKFLDFQIFPYFPWTEFLIKHS